MQFKTSRELTEALGRCHQKQLPLERDRDPLIRHRRDAHTALSHASRLSRAAGWLITPSRKDTPSADGATVRVLKRARLGAERDRGGLALVQAHELARDRVHLRAEALDLRVLGGELRRVCLVRSGLGLGLGSGLGLGLGLELGLGVGIGLG